MPIKHTRQSMYLNLRSLIIALIIILPQVMSSQTWSVNDYKKHNFKSFSRSEMANRRINPESIDYALLNAAVFYATNVQRVSHARQPFTFDEALEKAASGYSFDMREYDFFSHSSRVKGKETMKKRLALVGISETVIGENIAKTFLIALGSGEPYYTSGPLNDVYHYAKDDKVIPYMTYWDFGRDVVGVWMRSPGHKANILERRYKRMGCGVAMRKGKTGEVPMAYSTQNFSGDY